jgi:hypothetical protein
VATNGDQARTRRRTRRLDVRGRVRASRAGAAAALIVLVLAGCGSKPAPAAGPADAAFLKKAETACNGTLVQTAQQPFPYPSFNANDPVVTQLPQVGKYFDSLTFNHDELAFVKSFGKPKKGQHTWASFVDLVGQQQDLVAKQITEAKASNKPGFVATVTAISQLQTELNAAATAVGFAKDSSCISLF